MSDVKKPEVKTPDADALSAALKIVSEQLIPSAVASAVAAVSAQRSQAPQAKVVATPSHERCTDCGQLKRGCNGEHVQAVVYPTQYPQHAEYFRGAALNGVWYLSNDATHTVTIPAAWANECKNIVSTFERNEQEMISGRIKERFSGTVSPSGARTTQANEAWR